MVFRCSHSPHDPIIFQENFRAERDSAVYIACAAAENESLKPISVLDVFQTLQVERVSISFLAKNDENFHSTSR